MIFSGLPFWLPCSVDVYMGEKRKPCEFFFFFNQFQDLLGPSTQVGMGLRLRKIRRPNKKMAAVFPLLVSFILRRFATRRWGGPKGFHRWPASNPWQAEDDCRFQPTGLADWILDMGKRWKTQLWGLVDSKLFLRFSRIVAYGSHRYLAGLS